jgi:hypothetical protein
MKSRYLGGLLLAGILSIPICADMPEGYLDVFSAKVKLGKRVEFDAINKRMAQINRKNKGDNWLAYEIVYGEQNTVYFVSTRNTFGAAEAGTKAFEGALTESLTKSGMRSLFDAFDATVESEHSEFRRRRWDLSAGVPSDQAAYNRLIGESRYLRVVRIRTRPGKAFDYEKQLKIGQQAQERNNPGVPLFVSQSVVGQATGVYYLTTLVKSMGDFDNIKTLQQVLGSSYAEYQRATAESVIGVDLMMGRFLPEISNPPEEIVAIDPKFWRPAPTPVAAAPKPAAEAKK